MADVIIFAMAIASAVSLLTIGPHGAQRKTLRALRNYGETEAVPIGLHGEDVASPARDRAWLNRCEPPEGVAQGARVAANEPVPVPEPQRFPATERQLTRV